MGCRSDYMEQNNKERELQAACKIYELALTKAGFLVPLAVSTGAATMYCTTDIVPDLCKLIKEFDEEMYTFVLHDPKDPSSRKIALWWDLHLVADKARDDEKTAIEQQAMVRERALEKLTPLEREALGLSY